MIKSGFLKILLLMLACCSLRATDNSALSIINYTDDEEIKVTPTGTWTVNVAPGYRRAKALPHQTAAAQLWKTDQVVTWKPSPLTSDLSHSAHLIDAALAPDGSVLAILERIGGENKPNSSRIVLINLLSGGVLKGIILPQVRLERIRFPRGKSLELLALSSRQECFGQSASVLKIDLRSDQVRTLQRSLAEVLGDIADNGSVSVFSDPEAHKIYTTRGAELKLVGQPELRDARLNFTPDGKTLVVATPQKIIRYPMTEGVLLPEVENLKVPTRWSQMIVLDNSGRSLLLFAPGGEAVWLNYGVRTVLCRHAAGFGVYDPATHSSYVMQNLQGRLQIFRLPEVVLERTIRPVQIRPQSQAEVQWIFWRPHPKSPEIIALDSRGNVFRLIPRPRKWKKEFIYIADPTGIRRR